MIVDFSGAKWIWAKDNKSEDQKIVIRKKFHVEFLPETAEAYISCDTKFWLWINEVLVVYEGGVYRESRKGCGYAEKVDLAEYLHQGENIIAVLVWYYGNGGTNHMDSGEAGFIFKCDALGLYSGTDFLVAKHPAYVKTGGPYPVYFLGGQNIGFNACLDWGNFTACDFDDENFEKATEYENRVWGESILSSLPLIHLYEERTIPYDRTDTEVVAKLPYAMAMSVGFELEAEGGEVIDVRTDRYHVNGGPGDEDDTFNGYRIEYTAKPGRNAYKCLMYLYGERIIMSFPDTVKLTQLSYQESGYAAEQLGSFVTDNELFNRLIEKCIRTLYVCMRNNFMDCPDRERAQWIGDISVQAPQVAFIYGGNGMKLLKKSICDFIYLRKGDVLVGKMPGEYYGELPGQSLVAISEFGLIGEYYKASHDPEIPAMCLEPVVNYLKLWSLDDHGLLVPRKGDFRWFDHLRNVDMDVLENCLYLAAAKYALKMAEMVDRHDFDEFLKGRIEQLSDSIETYFWQGDHYASGDFVDDRANAVAVLANVCPKERYKDIRRVLLAVFHATPYMERFVLMALCEMGYIKDAYKRMMSRYYNLATNEDSTLWEDFYILGTRNHAWSGAPLEIAFKYILGLKTEDAFQSYTINPVSGIFKEMKCSFSVKGKKETICIRGIP